MCSNPGLLHVNMILANLYTLALIDQMFRYLDHTSLLIPMVKVLAQNEENPAHECEDNIDAISLYPFFQRGAVRIVRMW